MRNALLPSVLLGVLLLAGCVAMNREEDKWVILDGLGLPPDASQGERRDACHRALTREDGNHHDAFIYLAQVGNKSSVPLLIRALRWHPPFEHEGRQLIECTTAHCRDALNSLTGEKFGTSAERWKQWWDETGSKLADEHFRPRAASQKVGRFRHPAPGRQ